MTVRIGRNDSRNRRQVAAQPKKCAPAYEPPRVTKKRSVARVTLFSGGGPIVGGLVATGG